MNQQQRERIAEALGNAGMSPADLPGRTELAETVVSRFIRSTGHAPSWVWWVPGRLEIFGKHTDYAGGRSLVAAVPRGFVIAAAASADGIVRAHDARWNAAMELAPGDDVTRFSGWANYIAVAVRRLAHNFPGASLGADLVFASDLPRAAGVSSSSALIVAVSLALVRRAGLDSRPEWQRAIASRLDLAGYLGALENGLTFDSLTGSTGVGTHGGSEDHTAILNCRSGAVSAFRYVPVRPQGDAELPSDWRFVVMSSGVEAAKAGEARERYNRASLATRALTDVFSRYSGQHATTLVAALAAAGDLRTFEAAIDAAPDAGFSAGALKTRLAHFVAEDARVPLALEAVAAADRSAIEELSRATQRDAERLLGNQTPETAALAALALDSGAFASSSFGAGFGGSVWALVDSDDADAFAGRWRARYLERFSPEKPVAAFAVRPAPAATELSLNE
jgi:galactokinase